MIIIEPYWGTPVKEWSQVDWQGRYRGETGLSTNACWRNQAFVADRVKRVREVVDFVKRSPRARGRILGYIVWNENRWALGEETCYCDSCRTAWPKWLATQYATIDKLNTEYGSMYSSFDTVPMPTPIAPGMAEEVGMESLRVSEFDNVRHVSNENAWRDFHLFKADGLADFESAGAAAAKQADPGRLVITSLFTRGVNPTLGHILLRLYRAVGKDPNIDVVGGNQYEVFPLARAARHIEMWRSTPEAHRKALWFTEFNDIGPPFGTPYSKTILNATLAHTTFSGCSGRIWYTDKDASRLGVLEADGSQGDRYRDIQAAIDLEAAHADLVLQAARNDLPDQVAVIHLDEWNALADNEHYNDASLAEVGAINQWAGFSTRYVAEPDIVHGDLNRCKVAVLWQAQRDADIGPDMRSAISAWVLAGGTLLCDPPMLRGPDGVGPTGNWRTMAGVSFANYRMRSSVTIDDAELGQCSFTSPAGRGAPGPRYQPRDLGEWDVTTDKDDTVIPSADNKPAIVIHPYGKGRVINTCFRIAFTDDIPAMQATRARLLQKLIGISGIKPLVDAPDYEKTIAPQDHGGLIVTFFNPSVDSFSAPITFPGRNGKIIQTIREPSGAGVTNGAAPGSPAKLTVPAGEWSGVHWSGDSGMEAPE